MIRTLRLDGRSPATTDAAAPDSYPVAQAHAAVHARLENWGRWVRRSGGGSPATSPMFRLYRASNAREATPSAPSSPPDAVDAMRVERALRRLPAPLRDTLRWFYAFTHVPASNAARQIGVRPSVLPVLVHDGRTLLQTFVD